VDFLLPRLITILVVRLLRVTFLGAYLEFFVVLGCEGGTIAEYGLCDEILPRWCSLPAAFKR
jgi:hypothetical protein